MLAGGEGPDTFVFEQGRGHDTIIDFEAGVDRIDVTALVGEGAARNEFRVIFTGDGTRLEFDSGDTIELSGYFGLLKQSLILPRDYDFIG